MFKKDNGYWYFKYKTDSGEWKVYATRTKDEVVAREIESAFKASAIKKSVPSSLGELLSLFLDAKTNPQLLDAKITGKNYGIKHVQNVSRSVRDLIFIVKEKAKIDTIALKYLTRYQCKLVMAEIHEAYGNTEKAKRMFSQFKICLTYAADEGWIPISPAQGMPNIKAIPQKEIIPMTPNDIKEIISRPELFRFSKPFTNRREERRMQGRDKEDYIVFCVLALTGMRQAEVGALTSGQIQSGIYRGKPFHYVEVNRAFKDDAWRIVGKPKWDLCRSIPICEELYKKIESLISDDPNARLFPTYTHGRFTLLFERLKYNAELDHIDWEDREAFDMVSSHRLRHALNTNLLAMQAEYGGAVTEIMVAEYLSWEHQNQSRMQRRYTHLIASRLIPVANMIEEMYCNISVENIDKKLVFSIY